MPSGVIKKLVSDRGFGFIRGENQEIFFHASAVEGVGFEDLQEGQTVDFEVDSSEDPRRGNKGPRASVVRVG